MTSLVATVGADGGADGGPGLGKRSLSAVFWGGGGTVLRMLLQISAQVVLARLLGPEQYGIFAIGAIVVSFSAFLSDIGLAYGLIQKAEVTQRDIRFVFTWQVVLGLLVMAGVWLGAQPLAAYFGEPRAQALLQAMSVLCLLNALMAPSLNLLKRSLDFKRIQIAQLTSYVAGYVVVGIPMAMAGYQVWALAAAWIVQSALALLLMYLGTRHQLRPLFWYEQARAQAGYGGAVLATNLVNWVVNNADRVVVGRVFGSREIGLYATTYNFLYTPTAAALGVLQPVFFSASARVATEAQRIESGYRLLLAFVAAIVLPVFAVAAVMSESVILLFYGPQWQAAAALCRPIALAMPLFMLWGLTTPLLWTGGKPLREFQIQLPLALLWCGVCVLAARVSLEAMAWSVFALSFLRCGLMVGAAAHLRGMPWRGLWASAKGGLLLSVVMASLALLVDQAPWPLWVGAGLRLLAAAVVSGITWLALVRLWPALLPPELRQLLSRLCAKLPGRWRARLAFLDRDGA